MNRHPTLTAIWALLFLFSLAGPILAQKDLPKLVKKIQPAVVTIIAYNAQGKVKGQGSGFFISPAGDFITNYHVLTGAARAEVRTREGRRYPMSRVLAQDQAGDLVVAAIEPPRVNLPNLKISGVPPEVGEKVLVVGSPFGLEQTLSDGVVSAVRRIPDLGTILQITAPISSGSSGSPVVNMKGDVIGVATFIFKEGQNLNFAVPGSRVLALQRQASQVPEYLGPPRPSVTDTSPGHLRTQPTDRARALIGQANKFFKAGDDEKAAEACKELIRIQPGEAMAHYNLGGAYRNLGRWHEAAAAYKEAIRLQPNLAEAHHGMGLVYRNLGWRQEAVDAFKQAVRLKPDDPYSYLFLGESCFMLRRDQEAVDALKQAVRLAPDKNMQALAHYLLGGAFVGLGDRGAALEEYKILKALNPEMAKTLFDVIYK